MGKLIFDDRDGYSFISDNRVEYDLLEGRSLKGETTSDIVFVMLAYNDELFEYLGDRLTDEFLGYFYGASFVRENDKDSIEYLEERVAGFEKKHPEIVKFYKSKKKKHRKYRITIEATSIGHVEVEAENEDKAIELSELIESDKIHWDDGEYNDRVTKVEEI